MSGTECQQNPVSYEVPLSLNCEQNVAYDVGMSSGPHLQTKETASHDQADTYDYIGSSTGLDYLQPIATTTATTATTATVTTDTVVACKSCGGKAAGPGGMGRGWKVLIPLVLLQLVLTVLVMAAMVMAGLALRTSMSGITVVDTSSVEVQSLIARIQTLEMELLMRTTEPPVTFPTVARTTMSVTTPPTTDVTTTDIAGTTPMPTSPDLLPMAMEGEVTLSGVDLFQNCNSSVEETCTVFVGTGEGTGACFTDPLVPLSNTQGFALNMNCIRSAPSAESNPLIATLEVLPEGAGCICSVPDLDTPNRLFSIECGLLVTRCTVPTNITATLLSHA